jgi:CcmD family protein
MDEIKIALAVVNVGVWSALFWYLLRLDRKITRLEKDR